MRFVFLFIADAGLYTFRADAAENFASDGEVIIPESIRKDFHREDRASHPYLFLR